MKIHNREDPLSCPSPSPMASSWAQGKLDGGTESFLRVVHIFSGIRTVNTIYPGILQKAMPMLQHPLVSPYPLWHGQPMAQLLQHSILTSRSFGWAPCDWHRARDSEENCPSAIKCPHLPLSPTLERGTAAGCALAAPMPHPAPPALASENPLTHQIPLPGSNSLMAPAPTSSCQPYNC